MIWSLHQMLCDKMWYLVYIEKVVKGRKKFVKKQKKSFQKNWIGENFNRIIEKRKTQLVFILWFWKQLLVCFIESIAEEALVSKYLDRALLLKSFFKRMGQPRPLFRLFLVFPNKQFNFYNESMWKMSIQYMAPGFEPTTVQTWVVSHNH